MPPTNTVTQNFNVTSASGSYNVPIPPGNYRIRFTHSVVNTGSGLPVSYTYEWYNDTQNLNAAALLSVASGIDVSGIDAALRTVRRGDANCDGAINSVDASLVLQFNAGLFSPPSSTCLVFGEVNNNNVVNSVDSALILQFDAGLTPSLP